MLLRLGSMMSGGAAALGGAALLAAVGPFVAGVGTGVALVGGACVLRKAVRHRTAWRDEGGAAAYPDTADPGMPDEGEPGPAAAG